MSGMPFAFVGTRDRSITISSIGCDLAKVLPLHQAYGPEVFQRSGLELTDLERLVLAKLEHEIDHLHRFQGTTLGIFLFACFSRQVDLVLREIESTSENVELPFEQQSELMQEVMELFTLEKAMMSSSLQTSRMLERSLAESKFVMRFLGENEEVQWEPNRHVAPLFETLVGTIKRPTAVGGYSILEYLGLSREMGLRRKYNVFYEEAKAMIGTQSYQQLGQYWKAVVKRNTESTGGKYSLPSELYLACDLACWIPFGPRGLVERPSGRPYSWEDLQPGHRFTKLMRVIESIESKPSNAKLDVDYENWFVSSTETLCELLDWPQPKYLARVWIDFLAAIEKSPCRSWISEDKDRTQGTLTMLRLRLSHPAKAAQGYWSAFNKSSLWFSCVTQQTDKSQSMFRLTEHDKDNQEGSYNFPISLSLNSAIELFVMKRPESFFGKELLERYKAQTAKALQDLSSYALKQYGFKVQAGRIVV